MEASENRALPTELGHRKPHIGYKQMTPTEFMNHLQTNYSSGGAACVESTKTLHTKSFLHTLHLIGNLQSNTILLGVSRLCKKNPRFQ